MNLPNIHRIAIGTLLIVAMAGCSTPGRSSATKTTSGIATVQARLTSGEQLLNTTVESLVDLTNNPQADVRPQYKKFLDNLSKLEAQIKKGQSERAAMRTQAEAYFAKWEEDIKTLQNEEIKKVASARRDAAITSYQKIGEEFNKAKPNFQLFMNNLKEVQKAIDFDLTPGGITAIKPIVTKIQAESTQVKKSIGTVRAELERVAASMSATAPAPK